MKIHIITTQPPQRAIAQKTRAADPFLGFVQLGKRNRGEHPFCGDTNFLPNPADQGNYNTIPTLFQAWEYRKRRLWKLFVE